MSGTSKGARKAARTRAANRQARTTQALADGKTVNRQRARKTKAPPLDIGAEHARTMRSEAAKRAAATRARNKQAQAQASVIDTLARARVALSLSEWEQVLQGLRSMTDGLPDSSALVTLRRARLTFTMHEITMVAEYDGDDWWLEVLPEQTGSESERGGSDG